MKSTPVPRSLFPVPCSPFPVPRSLFPSPFSSYKGFTLVELLVVIGIIGILSGILLAVTGRGTESARAAKCLSNLRSLAQGANSAAMESGWYPLAGSIQEVGVGGRKLVYNEKVGWISWLSNHGDPFGNVSGNKPTSPASVDVCKFNETNEEDVRYAMTNGTIWKAVGKVKDVYTCPTHLLHCQRKKVGTPNWSYVMNAKFGHDYSQGAKGVKGGIEYGKLARADRILLFAELPTIDPKTGDSIAGQGDDWQKDCTLQYKASVCGKTYGKNWSGKAESVGFVHKTNKGRYCGHVAFADGHVEKLLSPLDGKGLTGEQLTTILCEGKDYSFDGSQYTEVKETD